MILKNFCIRSCYADTDAAGVIHHARYLEFFERSRTEWLEQLKAGPLTLELGHGVVLVIRETTLKFYQPGRLNDLLSFTHKITHRGRSQITIEQSAYRVPDSETSNIDTTENNLLATGIFHLVCVDLNTLKSTSLPPPLTDPTNVA